MSKIRFGVEIESCVDRDIIDELSNTLNTIGWKRVSDGSIDTRKSNHRAVEILSKVYNYTTAGMNQFNKKVDLIYPFIADINKTCGFHVHLSFDDYRHYLILKDWAFAKAFQNRFKTKFRRDKKRLDNNNYCKPYLDEKMFAEITGKQLKKRDKYGVPRYYAINYNSYNHFKTVEFRVFSGQRNPKQLMQTLKWLLEYVDKYIKDNKIGDSKATGNFTIKPKKKDLVKKSFDFDTIEEW